jgi:hypothetical protein
MLAEATFKFRFIVFILFFSSFAAKASIENVHKIKFAQLKVLNEGKKKRKKKSIKRNLSL